MWLQTGIALENLDMWGDVHLLGWAPVNGPNCPLPFSEAKESRESRRNCQISNMAAYIVIWLSRALAPLPGGWCTSGGWEGRFYFSSLLQLNSCQCMNQNFHVAPCKPEPRLINCPRSKAWAGEEMPTLQKGWSPPCWSQWKAAGLPGGGSTSWWAGLCWIMQEPWQLPH